MTWLEKSVFGLAIPCLVVVFLLVGRVVLGGKPAEQKLDKPSLQMDIGEDRITFLCRCPVTVGRTVTIDRQKAVQENPGD